MPHASPPRRHLDTAAALGLALLLGCSPSDASLHVVVDTTAAPDAVEVLAMSVRPERTRPAIDAAQLSDTARAVLALARTADSLDVIFQRERNELNREALALREADRLTPEYRTRYDAFNVRAAAAERLRGERDRARARARDARGDLDLPMLADLESSPPVTPAAESVQARARISDGVGNLRVAPGEWWVGAVNASGALVSEARQVTVQRAAGDTLRLP